MGKWGSLVNRFYYRDERAYEVPDSLDDLKGPTAGSFTLPTYAYSAPTELSRFAEEWAASHSPGRRALTGTQSTFSLQDLGETLDGYRAIITKGRVADQEAILNRSLLVMIWSEIGLPIRVEKLWRKKFPELREEPLPWGLPHAPPKDFADGGGFSMSGYLPEELPDSKLD